MLVLQLRNDDGKIIVDEQDWETVKEVRWHLIDGEIVSESGVTYDEYIGVGKNMKNKHNNIFDKRRKSMIPRDKNLVFSEYHGKFIIE